VPLPTYRRSIFLTNLPTRYAEGTEAKRYVDAIKRRYPEFEIIR